MAYIINLYNAIPFVVVTGPLAEYHHFHNHTFLHGQWDIESLATTLALITVCLIEPQYSKDHAKRKFILLKLSVTV